MMLLVALLAISCSSDDDDDVNNAVGMEVAGTYEGYTSAAFVYASTPTITNEESVNITYNDDGTVGITYTSDTWGTATIDATVVSGNSAYTISGTGTVEMENHYAGTVNSYDCTIAGTISTNKEDVELVISIPSVMQGTVITFHTGYAPANEFLVGTYEGYTSGEFVYATTPTITNDESVTITGNDDGTVSLTLESNQWGTTTIDAIAVEVSEDGIYTLSGEGETVMTSHYTGTSSSYACTLTGTVNADKSSVELIVTLPTVMGGTVLTFALGDAPTEDSAE